MKKWTKGDENFFFFLAAINLLDCVYIMITSYLGYGISLWFDKICAVFAFVVGVFMYCIASYVKDKRAEDG